ncbi:MAG: MOSC domain-containing protein [Flavobacteriales bacterium]|nr:MOSC domain-containing protein [Flavobacteriales bacterium]
MEKEHIRGKVIALSKSPAHTLIKENQKELLLLTGLGIEGDTHLGVSVKHRSRVRQNPNAPNLRQVHLIHSELHEELELKGIRVGPGQMGENITTKGIDLLSLPEKAILKIGDSRIEVTGLRNPCHQLNTLHDGLMDAVLGRDENGKLIRKAGIMAIVLEGGKIEVGDEIKVSYPKGELKALDKV